MHRLDKPDTQSADAFNLRMTGYLRWECDKQCW